MQDNTFTKTKIATSLVLILGSSPFLSAFAANEQPPEDIEIIQVTGIRGSLIKSMDVKRSSTGVVDAITSEDIGKFPDSNLAESLQRITGVSIDRSNSEGSKVTVRGFGPEFNLVTLNGRQMPTVAGRSYDFGNIATEGVSGVEVYKTSKANQASGGIGATINMITAKPLSSPGMHSSIGVKGVNEQSNEVGDDLTPELSGLYSNTFADDKFGFLISGSYQDRNNRSESAAVNNWKPNVDLSLSPDLNLEDNNQRIDGSTWYPQDINYYITDNDRQRTNGQMVFQFAPSDKIETTLDYTYSKIESNYDKNGMGIWFNQGGNVESAVINENGTYTDVTEMGGDYATNVSQGWNENENKSIGFNLKWEATDNLNVEFDAHKSKATSDIHSEFVIIGNTSCDWCEDAGADYGPNTATAYRKSADFNNELPDFDMVLVDGYGNPQDELTAADMGSLFGQAEHNYHENDMTEFRLKGTWTNGSDGALAKIEFGIGHTEMDFKSTRAFSENMAAGWWTWSAVHFDDDMFRRVDTTGLLSGFDGGGSDKSTNYYMTADFDELVHLWETIDDQNNPDMYSPSWDSDLNGEFQAGPVDDDSRVNEETTSAYVQMVFNDYFNDMPINMVIGLRYEETKVKSSALERQATSMEWTNGNEWQYTYADELTYSEGKGTTKQFLPNLDIDIEPWEDVIARFSYYRSMARPPINSLRSNSSYDGNPLVGNRKVSVGDPGLEPYIADNIDFSLEYYYDEGSYVSAGYFKKRVENFLVNTTDVETMNGMRDPYAGPRAEQARQELIDEGVQPSDQAIHDRINENQGAKQGTPITPNDDDPLAEFYVSSDKNQETANMYGWELAMQHMIGNTGFGFQANATFVHGDVEADRDAIDQEFALPGLSDSMNFSAIYDKDGLSARLSYNWRDEFLAGFDQHSAPIFTEAYAQWDANVNYSVNDDFTIFVEGLNLTKETQRTYVRYEEQMLHAAEYGSRYNVGMRYNF